MATYRVTGDPRKPEVLQAVVDLLRHLDGFGIGKTAIAVRLTSGGAIDVTTSADLPNGQKEHLGVEKI